MKYEIEFDNNMVDKIFMDLHFHFDWCENSFEVKDIERTISNAVAFQERVKILRLFGAETDCGLFNDNGCTRIGFARINNHTFVENASFKIKELKDALWEIAHPETK